MYRIVVVLLCLIIGVSTRGVPEADDENGIKIEPKRSETDQENYASEHVTSPLDCKDCNKDGVKHDGSQARATNTGAQITSTLEDTQFPSDNTKLATNKVVKPFLTFHRIKVKVNKESKDDRRPKHKGRRRKNNGNSNIRRHEQLVLQGRDSKEEKLADDIKLPTSNEKLSSTDKSGNTESIRDGKDKEVDKNIDLNEPGKDTNEHSIKLTETTANDNDSNRKQTDTHVDQVKENKEHEHIFKENTHIETTLTEKIANIKEKRVDNLSPNAESEINYKIDRSKSETKDEIKPTVISGLTKPGDNAKPVKDVKPAVKTKDYEIISTKEEALPTNAHKYRKEFTKKNDFGGKDIPKYTKGFTKDVTTNPKDEKKSVDYAIPRKADGRWSRKGLSQVPDVERLERRLHPTVDAPVQDIIKSMRNMMGYIRGSIHRVDEDYKMIQNTTRWKYMTGVREQLGEIANENDDVYDVVMEASLLTKQIYMKAHERKHPRVNVQAMAVSYRSRLNTDMHSQINTNYFSAQRELDIANQLLDQIKALRKRKDDLYDDKIELYQLVRDRLPLRSLHDLYRRADQTINILTSARPLARSGNKALLYSHMHNDTKMNMRESKALIVEGLDVLQHAKRVLMDNQRKAQECKRITRNKLSTSNNGGDNTFDFTRMDMFISVDSANLHASSLSDRAALIHMKLVPLIKKAKEAMAGGKGVGLRKRLEESASKLNETVKTFLGILDEIRMIFGDENVFKERCEVIHNAKFFLETPINCTKYKEEVDDTQGEIDDSQEEIDEFSGEGTGSGEFDETLIDMEVDSDIPLSNVSNGESVVDIDFSTKNENKTIEITKENNTVDVDLSIAKEDTIIETKKENKTVDVDLTKIKETKPTEVPKENKTPTPAKTKQPVAVSTNDLEIDDEDRLEELRLKMTTKTAPVTTTSTPSTTTTSIPSTTSSPDSEDLFFDVFDWWNDAPAEDTVIIDPEADLDLIPLVENKTFNELIRERLYNYSKTSKALFQDADQAGSKIKEISLTWQKVKQRSSSLENKTLDAVSVMSKWRADKSYFKAVHDRVKSVEDDIGLRTGVVEGQCNDAVDRAIKKHESMTKLYEKQLEKSKNAGNPQTTQEAVSQVNVAVSNVNTILRLKQLYPSPCSRLEGLDRKIRSNITDLRQKIERAKLIASSIQIAVAVPKKGYLEFPVPQESQSVHPLTSEVNMVLKHTGSDGRLVSLQAGDEESLALEVNDDALTVVQSIDGDEKRLSLYDEAIEDQWYFIRLQRFATFYNVTMYGNTGVLGTVGTATSGDEYRAMSLDLLPTTLRLGTSEDLTACALGLEINGKSVNIFDMPNNESIATPCSTQGRWTSMDHHLLLDGSGYARISLSDLPTVRTLQSVKVSFNARSDGTVLNQQPRRMATVDVYMDKGYLMIYVAYRNFETKLKSTTQVYNTDQVVEIVFKNQRTFSADVLLNGKSNVFKTAKGKKRDITPKTEDIFIGGLQNYNSSMVGCVKSLEINGEVVPYHILRQAQGISYGKCRKMECTTFDDDSVPIEMDNLTSVHTIYVAVKRGSLGPVLTFSKHKKKFDLIVFFNTEGVSLEETVADTSKDISLDESTDEFIMISIQDDVDDESVKVTIGDSTKDFSYKKGGGAWGGWGNKEEKKDNGPISYSLSLGKSSVDTLPFIGTMQNLIIDGRPVDLLQYEESSKLHRCTVDPVPRNTDIVPSDEKVFTCK